MENVLSPELAVERLTTQLSHLWMVRTFLKHAPEIEDDQELLEVPRTLFDCIRAVEPARERGDWTDFLRRLQGKMSKIRRAAELLQREHKRVSDHTNFQMAVASLNGAVHQMDQIFATLAQQRATPTVAEPS